MLLDQKYLGMVSTKLRNYSKKGSRLYNCSCPLCGDSSSDKKKARGYFMPKNKGSGLYYYCHKCNEAMPFGLFLRRIDGRLYEEYRRERIGSKYSKLPETVIPAKLKSRRELATSIPDIELTNSLSSMTDMPSEVSKYLIDRKIPLEMLLKYFFYTDDFKSLANMVCPGSFPDNALKYKEPRIIITMLDPTGKLIGIQGRAIAKSRAKYVTIKTKNAPKKIFGLDRIRHNRPVYVFEGPIDSCFVENAIGVCGADLVSQVEGMSIDPIFCFDNEPYSKIITKKIYRAIENNKKVVIFPRQTTQKDINDMVLAGIDVNKLLKERTFSGLRARAEFNQWSRRSI